MTEEPCGQQRCCAEKVAPIAARIAALEAERDAAMRNWVDAQDAWEATLPVVEAAQAVREQHRAPPHPFDDWDTPINRLIRAVDAFESGPHNTGSEAVDG